MARSEMRKVLKYIKAGSVSKLRHFVRKHDVDLNKIRDSEERGVLHLACYLGNGRVAKYLLRCGADPCMVDAHGNTALHTALEYALELNSELAFVELVLPLKKKSKRVMHLRNKKGDTPEELFCKLKTILRRNLSLDNGFSGDEDGRCRDSKKRKVIQNGYLEDTKGYEKDQREHSDDSRSRDSKGYTSDEEGSLWDRRQHRKTEDLEWEEKLAFENSCEEFYFKEDSPVEELHRETYSEWAERIRREFNAKRETKTNQQTRQELHEKASKKIYYEDLTKKLANEHQEYVDSIRLKTKKERLTKEREEYEQRCGNVFENDSKEMLGIWDIPWPCQGSAADIVDKLCEWSEDCEKIKYLKIQRVRWHPDRFLQRCRQRLKGKDRDMILDLVKQISQGINTLIESL